MRLETCSLSFQRKGHLDVHVEWDTATRSWVISRSTQIDRARKKSVRDGRVQTLRKQVRERGRGVIHPTECRPVAYLREYPDVGGGSPSTRTVRGPP